MVEGEQSARRAARRSACISSHNEYVVAAVFCRIAAERSRRRRCCCGPQRRHLPSAASRVYKSRRQSCAAATIAVAAARIDIERLHGDERDKQRAAKGKSVRVRRMRKAFCRKLQFDAPSTGKFFFETRARLTRRGARVFRFTLVSGHFHARRVCGALIAVAVGEHFEQRSGALQICGKAFRQVSGSAAHNQKLPTATSINSLISGQHALQT